MKPKGYYEALVAVINLHQNGKYDFHYKDVKASAGNYTDSVCDFLNEKGVIYKLIPGIRFLNNPLVEDALRQEALDMISYLDAVDQDRRLSNEESECNIKYGRKGYRLSIIAIVISSAAILLEIAKWIWPPK